MDIFEVVGAPSTGAIAVRAGKDQTSGEAVDRLATGSLVKVLERGAGCIRYELVRGAGPPSGWVSTHFEDKALLVPLLDEANELEPAEKEAKAGQASREEAVLRWYSELFLAEGPAADEEPAAERSVPAAAKAVEPLASAPAELARELGAAPPQRRSLSAEERRKARDTSKGEQLVATFGCQVGNSGNACHARFDIRDEVCRRMGGFKHGQAVCYPGAEDVEYVVVGVKVDRQAGEQRLWLRAEDPNKPTAFAVKPEDLPKLLPVYKGVTRSIRKRVELQAASMEDFEAAEDSDGECMLLCEQCHLPVGTKLYSDGSGNPLHAECMAQRVQHEMREKEQKVQEGEAAEKKVAREKYSIGWCAEQIPCNLGPAAKLALCPAPKGMCCLMLQRSSEGRPQVSVVPTVDPAAAINLEYLSLALKVRYLEGREPTFSLDPVLDGNLHEVKKHMQVKNFEPQWLQGTSAGEVLFQSDYHLKELSMGDQEQPIVGMRSCFDDAAEAREEWHAREWYVVRKAEMHMSEDNVLIPFLKMGVEAREQILGAEGLEDKPITRPDHPLVKYAQAFTDNFDLIAERRSVVHHLRELAKASLLAKFLLESEVQLEGPWMDLAGEAASDCCMEIPQLWNERCLAQIRVQEGKIMDPSKLQASDHQGVYGGVKFGLDRFRLAGAVTARPGLRAAPSIAARAAMPTLSMSDVRSMGMLVVSMQGRGAPPPVAIEEVPAAVVRPSMAMPGVPMRGAPLGAAPSRPAPSAGYLTQQMQGMLVSQPGLEGRRARLDVPSLHGVDLNLDKFNVEEPTRVPAQVSAGDLDGEALAGVAISKAFWSNLDSNSESVFKQEDKSLLRKVFNPYLSDRRTEGEKFTPPAATAAYMERLRGLVKLEDSVQQRRAEHFFSSRFSVADPGPLFPCSWRSSYEIRTRADGPAAGSHLQPRPEYVAQASMFDRVLATATPVFDKRTEEGLRFRTYKFGSLDVRTTQEHDGLEVVGAVFSVRAPVEALSRRAEATEKVVKVTEYIREAAAPARRSSYIALETEGGSIIVTEKLADGSVAWEENPEDLEDRSSLAKFIRSCACSCTKRTEVTVGDIEAYRKEKAASFKSSNSGCKRYAQGVYNCARGLADRLDSGFGSKASWNRGKEAQAVRAESRKESRRSELNARKVSAKKVTQAQAGSEKVSNKVINPVIVGSWDEWTFGEPMVFDEQRGCYTVELQMRSTGKESFQILSDNDWDKCLHPDREDACMQEEHGVCGPDGQGHGKNWTIGAHRGDRAMRGVVYRIMLKVGAGGAAEGVSWERLGVAAVSA